MRGAAPIIWAHDRYSDSRCANGDVEVSLREGVGLAIDKWYRYQTLHGYEKTFSKREAIFRLYLRLLDFWAYLVFYP